MSDLHDLEQHLRADLAATATRISPSPGAPERAIERALTPARAPRERIHVPRWLLPLTAAATVLILASATVLLIDARRTSRSGAPPGPVGTSPAPTSSTSAPTPHPTPSGQPTLPVVDGVHPASCRVADPSGFTNAFRTVGNASPTSYNLAGSPILSVTSDGDVLAGPRTTPGRLDLISPAGSVTTLYKTTDVPLELDESAMITAAQADSRWVEFAVSIGNGQLDVRRLAVFDRASGAVTAFRSLPVNSPIIILPPVLFQDAVYWTEVDSGGSGSVFRYDPATGRTDTIGSGTLLSSPTLIGGGLYWQRGGQVVTYRPGRIPAGYPLGGPKIGSPVTDGTTSVWATTVGSPPDARVELMLSRPDLKAPIAIYQTPADGFADPRAVVGPFVIWKDATSLVVLDTRTGATATPFPASGPEFTTAAVGGTVLAINEIGSKGGAQLLLAQTNTLPELRC
jgi:hypothetical protein